MGTIRLFQNCGLIGWGSVLIPETHHNTLYRGPPEGMGNIDITGEKIVVEKLGSAGVNGKSRGKSD